MFELQWRDVRTGRPDAPHYVTWWKWTKFFVNIVSAVLAIGSLSASHGHASRSKLDGAFIFVVLLRLIEIVKDVVPLLLDCRRGLRKCDLIVYLPVCHTREDAARIDKNIKYVSSLLISPALAFLSLVSFFVNTAVWGCLLLGILSAIDYLVAVYVVIVDECVKDRSLVRMRPNDIELDDSLDDDLEESTAFAPHIQKVSHSRQWNRLESAKLDSEYGEPVAVAAVATQQSIGAYRSDMHTDKGSASQ